jgi:hypothetical protein
MDMQEVPIIIMWNCINKHIDQSHNVIIGNIKIQVNIHQRSEVTPKS